MEGRARQVQPLHRHLVAAHSLDLVVEQHLAGLSVAWPARGGQLTDHVHRHGAQIGGG
jgi:hypothetical protein